MPARVELPTAGTILGTVVRALRLLPLVHTSVSERTARRVFRGEPGVKESERREVVEAAVKALFPLELLETWAKQVPHIAPDNPASAAVAAQGQWVAVVWGWMEAWDLVAAHLRGHGPKVRTREMPLLPWFRLLAWELALRCAGYMHALDLDPISLAGAEAVVNGQAFAFLLRKYKDAHPTLTRDAIAKKAGVSPSTVDAWLAGKSLPRPEGVLDIAATICNVDPSQDEDLVAFHLRVTIAVSEFMRRLEQVSPKSGSLPGAPTRAQHFPMLFTTATHYIRQLIAHVPLEHDLQRKLAFHFAIDGSHLQPAPIIIGQLTDLVRDSRLRQDLAALAAGNWPDRVVALYREVCDPLEAAEDEMTIQRLAEHGPGGEDLARAMVKVFRSGSVDGPILWGVLCPNPYGWWVPAFPDAEVADGMVLGSNVPPPGSLGDLEHRANAAQYIQGDPMARVRACRDRVDLTPNDAMAHFHLGVALAEAGQPAEGIQECRIAKALQPDWSNPAVEVAIILEQSGRPGDALTELEKVAEHYETDAHLAYTYGVVLVRLERFDEAEEWLVKAIEHNQDHPGALAYLAHCFLLRKKRKEGRRLAKRAAQLGQRWVLDDLQDNRYPSR